MGVSSYIFVQRGSAALYALTDATLVKTNESRHYIFMDRDVARRRVDITYKL